MQFSEIQLWIYVWNIFVDFGEVDLWTPVTSK